MSEESTSVKNDNVLIFLTNTFPFSPGEEFIEAELPILSKHFDKVIIVPSFPYLNQGERRGIPPSAELLVPVGLDGSKKNYLDVAKFALRRPLRTLKALSNALVEFPNLRNVVEDFKLDLFARMIVDSVYLQVEKSIDGAGKITLYSYWMYAPARVAIELKSKLKLIQSKVISRAHGYDVFSERRPSNFLPQRRLLFKHLEAVFPVSNHGKKYLQAKFPEFAEKIHTRRLGVGEATNPGNVRLSSHRVYSCAHLHPIKRIPLLIDALAEVQGRGVKVDWTHIGSSADSASRQKIENYAKKRLQPETFEFAGGLSNRQVRELYGNKSGTVFINTSESEGVPVSVMEALAQGFPVIATDVGGNSELIDTNQGMFDGLLTSNPEPDEIADRIINLFESDPEVFDGYVKSSLNYWQTNWFSDVNYMKFTNELA